MLRTGLIHPEILHALGRAGHGSLVLVSDGNFPHDTAPYRGAQRVFLNLAPGTVTVGEVLDALVPVLPIERLVLMDPQDGEFVPPAHAAVAAQMPEGTAVAHLRRFDFYEAVTSPSLALVIATGDTRPYANALLTVGVVAGAS